MLIASIIRPAAPTDLRAIAEIYNEAVLTTDATMDTEPRSDTDQKHWYDNHGENNPILVLEADGRVVGWASLSKWSDRCGYSGTSEISVYVKEEFRDKGFGKKLIDSSLKEAKKLNHHSVIARITTTNGLSIRLHQGFGFEIIGTLKEVGYKFGKWLDVLIMQKNL